MNIRKPVIFWIGIVILIMSIIMTLFGGAFPPRSKKDKPHKNYIVLYIGLCLLVMGVVLTLVGLLSPVKTHTDVSDTHSKAEVHVLDLRGSLLSDSVDKSGKQPKYHPL